MRWGKTITAMLCLFAISVLPSTSAMEPFARTKCETTGDIWVGQRVTVVVELVSPGFFAGSPAFDLPQVPGVIVCPPDDRPVVSSESIGDVSCAVQRHELAVFAQRAGRVEIPSFAVRFGSRQGTAEAVDQRVTTDPIIFETRLPPGAEGLTTLITAHDLRATETWRPEPASAKVGDAFARTIVFSAPDVPAMMLPAVPAPNVDGLGVYPKAPQVRDFNDRGRRLGERTESISYVCERPGRVQVPAMKLTWWDSDHQQLKVVEFPARAFDVAPNPALTPAAAPAKRAWNEIHRTVIRLGLAGLLLAGVTWRTRRRWPEWRQPVVTYWSPVHLVPLNPIDQEEQK